MKHDMKKYIAYIIFGLCYPLVKGIYYIHGSVCIRGLLYGIIAGVLSICFGILSYREYSHGNKPLRHWLAALLPLFVIVFTPIIMFFETGFQMLTGDKLQIFLIFEGIALAQLTISVLMFRNFIFKQGQDRVIMPAPGFMIMKTVLRVRNIFRKPDRIVRGMGLKKGQFVLDNGCGIGSFSFPASEIVGDKGCVYALDIHPLAIKTVEKEIKKKSISNIKTILTGRDTHLADESVDVVLLIDMLQMITDKLALLQELYRILKKGGIIFATAEHLAESEFMAVFSKNNLFTLIDRKQKLFKFRKNEK